MKYCRQLRIYCQERLKLNTMLKNTIHLFFLHCWTQAFGIIKVVRFLKTKAKKVHMQNDKPMLFSNTIWLSMSVVHMHQNTSEFSHYHKNIIKYSTKFDLKIIVHPCNLSNSFIFPLVVLFNLFFFKKKTIHKLSITQYRYTSREHELVAIV